MRLPFNARFLVLGMLVYIIVLILSFPADRAYAYWKNYDNTNRDFSLAGISGSVWSGRAGLGNFQGESLKDIEWSLRPWYLLLGQVGVNWSFSLAGPGNAQGFGRGVTLMGLDGSVDFSRLEASVSAAMTAKMARMMALRPAGTVNLNLQEVKWSGQNLVSASGRVVWRGAGINLIKPISLGDLTLILETEGDKIKGVISDSGGPLSIAGVLSLNADGTYQVNGTMAARNDADLQNALRSLGRPGPDGKVKINYSGSLTRLGVLPNQSKR